MSFKPSGSLDNLSATLIILLVFIAKLITFPAVVEEFELGARSELAEVAEGLTNLIKVRITCSAKRFF